MAERKTSSPERSGESPLSPVARSLPKGRQRAAGRKGPHGGRRQGKGGRRKPGVPPKLAKKAEEIAKRTGLGRREALRVASGKATVQQVLKEMLVREKLKAEVSKGELDPMYVPAIVGRQMTLDRAKFLTRLLKDEAWRSTASILEELVESGRKQAFVLFDRKPFVAKVARISKYDVWFQKDEGGEPEQTEKHNIIVSCAVEELDELEASTQFDEDVRAKHLGASVSYKDRFRSDKEVLYRYHLSGEPVRVTFRDGRILTGRVGWFGRWEFELKVSDTCRPVVFRHAMYALGGA